MAYPSAFNSDPSPSRKTSSSSSVSVPMLSCSISQIVELFVPEIGLIVHKHLVNMVKILARVVSSSNGDMFLTIYVSDGTFADGLKVIKYRHCSDLFTVSEGSYYKIFGKIRMENGITTLVAYQMIPVNDFNELSMHCCEVVRESLELRKNKLKSICEKQTLVNKSDNNKPINTNPVNQGGINQQKDRQIFTGNYVNVSDLHSDIVHLLTYCKKPEGLSKQEIRNAFPDVPVTKINDAINFLDCEAHIYQTIDDDHYKSVQDPE